FWNDLPPSFYRYIMEIALPTTHSVSSPVNLENGLISGSDFPIGVTTMTYSSTGGSTCSFTVTMNEPPATNLTCPPNIVTCSNPVYYNLPTGKTNCNNCTFPTTISGFTYIGMHNGHAYFRSNSNYNWSNARTVAASNGGYLASINNLAENEFLKAAVIEANLNHWIGFTDETTEGTFTWVNGDPVTYTNWTAGEP